MQQHLPQQTTPNRLSVPALALLGVFSGIVAVHLGVILFVLGLDSLDLAVSHALAVTAAQATVVLAWLLIPAAFASLLFSYARSVSAVRARLRLTTLEAACSTPVSEDMQNGLMADKKPAFVNPFQILFLQLTQPPPAVAVASR